MIYAEQPALAADTNFDVRQFDRVQIVVTGMPTSGAITCYASARKGGLMQAYAGVKQADLTVVTAAQTITANGAYSFDALAEFKWSLTTQGTGAAPTVDLIAKG